MLILNKMLVKDFSKKIFSFLLAIVLILFSSTISHAVSPSFSLYPNGGTVLVKDNGFTVDVMIDTDGEEITEAKFVLLFDPSVLQLTKTERNNSLFVEWPEDESTVDNENGVVMLSGFTQVGAGTLYTTGSEADVFARLSFKVLKEGQTTLDWEYGTSNGVFETVMMKDGSPSQNILTTKPSSSTFVIGDDVLDPSDVNTGIGIDRYVFFTGLVLLLFGGFMIFTRPGIARKRKGTVVVYDNEK